MITKLTIKVTLGDEPLYVWENESTIQDGDTISLSLTEFLGAAQARAEAAEAKLGEYQLRLAGALTALDGHAVDQSDPKMLPFLRSCPTIAAAVRERKGREAAEAKLAEVTARCETLGQLHTTMEQGIAALETKLTEAEAKLMELRPRVDVLESEAGTLTVERDGLRAKLAEAERERQPVDAVIAASAGALSRMQERMITAEADAKALRELIAGRLWQGFGSELETHAGYRCIWCGAIPGPWCGVAEGGIPADPLMGHSGGCLARAALAAGAKP